jgi:site-specific DNA recombinase
VLQARDRIRAAFGNAGFDWPDRRVTVSLPPSDLPKHGPGFDLPKSSPTVLKLAQVVAQDKEPAMGNRAAIYTRISQDRTGAGLAVERQEVECRQLAERLGLTIVEVYSDNDISAYSGKPRPGYRRLLAAIRGGQVGAVVVWHLDRLTRQPSELETYLDVARDVPTYSVTAGQLDLATPSGKMTARIAAAVAAAEVERMKERKRSARDQAAAAGRWTGGRRPFGYQGDGVTVVEAEAEAIRWAATELLGGTSLNKLAAELNRRGVQTSTGGRWAPTEVRRMLLRPRNAGLMQHRGQEVGPADWPAILDETVWRGVVAKLSDTSRRKNLGRDRRWLMSGLARCGAPVGDTVCDAPVKATSAGGQSRGRRMKPGYTCRSGKHVVRDAAELDAYVEAIIVEWLSRPDAAELLAPDQRGDTAALLTRDAALRERLEQLGRDFATGAIDAITLRAGTEQIRHDREQITAELAAASAGSVLAGVADAPDPAKVWVGLDLSRKRAIVDVLIDVVILPAHKGRRPGWRVGETYFDPASVEITWKR